MVLWSLSDRHRRTHTMNAYPHCLFVIISLYPPVNTANELMNLCVLQKWIVLPKWKRFNYQHIFNFNPKVGEDCGNLYECVCGGFVIVMKIHLATQQCRCMAPWNVCLTEVAAKCFSKEKLQEEYFRRSCRKPVRFVDRQNTIKLSHA